MCTLINHLLGFIILKHYLDVTCYNYQTSREFRLRNRNLYHQECSGTMWYNALAVCRAIFVIKMCISITVIISNHNETEHMIKTEHLTCYYLHQLILTIYLIFLCLFLVQAELEKYKQNFTILWIFIRNCRQILLPILSDFKLFNSLLLPLNSSENSVKE